MSKDNGGLENLGLNGGTQKEKKGRSDKQSAIDELTREHELKEAQMNRFLEGGAEVLEQQAGSFLGGMAKGFLDDKATILGADLRLVLGVAGVGASLYGEVRGAEGAGHALALSSGFLSSWTSDKGQELGQRLAKKRTQPGGGTTNPPTPAGAPGGAPAGGPAMKGEEVGRLPLSPLSLIAPAGGARAEMEGERREVYMTPASREEEDDPAMRDRFVRTRPLER